MTNAVLSKTTNHKNVECNSKTSYCNSKSKAKSHGNATYKINLIATQCAIIVYPVEYKSHCITKWNNNLSSIVETNDPNIMPSLILIALQITTFHHPIPEQLSQISSNLNINFQPKVSSWKQQWIFKFFQDQVK